MLKDLDNFIPNIFLLLCLNWKVRSGKVYTLSDRQTIRERLRVKNESFGHP